MQLAIARSAQPIRVFYARWQSRSWVLSDRYSRENRL